MLKIKLFAAFAFLAIVAGIFLFSNDKTQAQTGSRKRDEVLEKVADYKGWKQVQKPETKSTNLLTSNVVQIDNSTVAG